MDGMLLPMNFRKTEIALQPNPNIRAVVSIVEEELHVLRSGITQTPFYSIAKI